MTGEELIKYIQDNNLGEYEIQIQYRDSGGFYYGETDLEIHLIEFNDDTKIITF